MTFFCAGLLSRLLQLGFLSRGGCAPVLPCLSAVVPDKELLCALGRSARSLDFGFGFLARDVRV